MSIYVTGDIHGYPIRLTDEILNARGLVLTKADKLIICGDFGLPWYNDVQDLQCLEWLAQRPFEILFLDGNHENFDLLNEFPVEERHGGKVQKVRDNVFHLMRGEVYEIEGKRFFVFGGATSVDRYMREVHVDWWAEEVFSKEEKLNAIHNLVEVGFEVDYVITHTAPRRFVNNLSVHLQDVSSCPVANFLDELSFKLTYKKWFFGHFHIDACVGESILCLYEDIKRV